MAFVLPVEELLQQVSGETPVGVLDAATEAQISALDGAVKRASDTGFQSLRAVAEALFRGGKTADLSDRTGDTMVEVQPIRHLKPAMVLALVGLELEGLPGFADGLQLVERLLATQWETLFPRADEDPEDPYHQRVTILNPLSLEDPSQAVARSGPVTASDSWQIADRLLKVTLIESERQGPLSVRDCLSPWSKGFKLSLPPGEDRSADFIAEARLGAITTVPRQREALKTALAAIESIDALFKQAPGNVKPKLGYLTRLLRGASMILEDGVGTSENEPVTGSTTSVAGTPRTNGEGSPAASREAAVRKLLEAEDYFHRYEPGSPLPLLIARIRRLAGMNFLSLLEELKLGKEAVPEFRKLAGMPEGTSSTTSSGGEAKPTS
jgi:type VI secretion system protein ImpA